MTELNTAVALPPGKFGRARAAASSCLHVYMPPAFPTCEASTVCKALTTSGLPWWPVDLHLGILDHSL